MSNALTPEKALIFRITDKDNIPWILGNGLHCRNSNHLDPNFVTIVTLKTLIEHPRHIAARTSTRPLS